MGQQLPPETEVPPFGDHAMSLLGHDHLQLLGIRLGDDTLEDGFALEGHDAEVGHRHEHRVVGLLGLRLSHTKVAPVDVGDACDPQLTHHAVVVRRLPVCHGLHHGSVAAGDVVLVEERLELADHVACPLDACGGGGVRDRWGLRWQLGEG